MASSANKYYLSVLICINMCVPINGIQWIRRPIDLHQCQGDNVDLNWHYNTSSTSPVSLKFWLFPKTGNTLTVWADHRSYKVYPAYAGRVTPLDDHNAGIRLHNVTPADSGVYKLELAGPGVVDTANVTVYNETLLQPTLEVDGVPRSSGDWIQAEAGDGILLKFSSKTGLVADSVVFIKEDTDGNNTQNSTCFNQTICQYKIKLSTSGNFTIYINVRYPVCAPVSMSIQLSVQENSPMSTWMLVGIIAGAIAALVIVVAAVIGVKKFVHVKHKQSSPKEPQNEDNDYHDEQELSNVTTTIENNSDNKVSSKQIKIDGEAEKLINDSDNLSQKPDHSITTVNKEKKLPEAEIEAVMLHSQSSKFL